MKKLFALLLAATMLLCFAACAPTQTPGTPDTQEPAQDSFTFTYKGTKIALNAPAEAVVAALGEPLEYSESTSCAFDGLDKQYKYDSFYLETYPLNGKDYIYGWWFVDDLVETDEGICIGSTQADVEAAYGAENYNGSNAFKVVKGSGSLTVILENGVVTSIQYGIMAS